MNFSENFFDLKIVDFLKKFLQGSPGVFFEVFKVLVRNYKFSVFVGFL